MKYTHEGMEQISLTEDIGYELRSLKERIPARESLKR